MDEIIRDTLGGSLSVQHFDIKELIDKWTYETIDGNSYYKDIKARYDYIDRKSKPPEKAGYVCTMKEYRLAEYEQIKKECNIVRIHLNDQERKLSKLRDRHEYLRQLSKSYQVKIDTQEVFSSLDMY